MLIDLCDSGEKNISPSSAHAGQVTLICIHYLKYDGSLQAIDSVSCLPERHHSVLIEIVVIWFNREVVCRVWSLPLRLTGMTLQFNLISFSLSSYPCFCMNVWRLSINTICVLYICIACKPSFFPFDIEMKLWLKFERRKGVRKKLDRLISRSTISITHDHHKPDHRPPPFRHFPLGHDWINIHLCYISIGHHLYPFRMVSLGSAPSIHPVLSVSSRLSCCISPFVLYMRCSYRKLQTNVAPPELHPLLLSHTLFSPLQCWSCWKWPLGWELCWTPWSRLCLRCVSYVSLHTYTHPQFPSYLQDNKLT